jgi:hypothetical protein
MPCCFQSYWGILSAFTVILFCTGQIRFRGPHIWIAIIGISVLLAYLLAAETGLASLFALVALLWTSVRRVQQGDMAIVRVSVFTLIVAMFFIDLFPNPVVAVPFWACLGTLLAGEQRS